MQCLETKQPFCSCEDETHTVRMGEWNERRQLGSFGIMEALFGLPSLGFMLYGVGSKRENPILLSYHGVSVRCS